MSNQLWQIGDKTDIFDSIFEILPKLAYQLKP